MWILYVGLISTTNLPTRAMSTYVAYVQMLAAAEKLFYAV